MIYLKVSIIENPAVIYEEHSNGTIRFTDKLGNTLIVPDNPHYTSRDSVITPEVWMILDPIIPANITLFNMEFQLRFTTNERLAIRAAAKVDPHIEDLMALLNSTPTINLNDPLTVQGVQLFEQVGLIGIGRANQILGV